jgi:hypothetical protein
VQLHPYLPAHYTGFSGARGVWQEGPTVYVVGYAESNLSGTIQAVMWIGTHPCYANCDSSSVPPALNVADFTCFLRRFAAGDPYANCDASPAVPTLNVADFTCFLQRFAAGCQ